jgi:phosphoglycerate dehydrogenase-like enzyme
MADQLVIWSNVPLDGDSAARRRLADATAEHQLHLVDATTPTDQALARLAEADVVFGKPPVEAVLASTRLAWLAIAAAGYEAYDRDDVRAALTRRGVPMTNAGGVYADACAQHVLAMMLAAVRHLPEAMEAQREARWAFADLRGEVSLLTGARVLLLGWGQIARRLAALLAAFEVEVRAVRRHRRGDESVPVLLDEDLDDALGETDHLVDLLPGGAHTRHFVDASLLARLKPGAWVYNVGRGSTVDHAALVDALERGHVAGAWLDVTDPEPPGPDHPLWRTPRCHITPHIAGGHAGEKTHQVRHFLANLARFTAGAPLQDRIW